MSSPCQPQASKQHILDVIPFSSPDIKAGDVFWEIAGERCYVVLALVLCPFGCVRCRMVLHVLGQGIPAEAAKRMPVWMEGVGHE